MKNLRVELSRNCRAKYNDTDDIGFGNVYTDHMMIMEYDESDLWHNARIIPYQNISLDPCSMCFHYGQTVFEGLKAYKCDNGDINLFRPYDNFHRLNKSCDRLCIPNIDVDFCVETLKELVKIDKDWIPKKDNASLYIRPFIIATQVNLGVCPSNRYYYIVVMSPSGPYYKDELKPVKICVETDYVRAVKGGIGMAKTGGNYAASIKSQVNAYSLDCSQTLWLDGIERKYIEEVGAMNIFFVLDDEIVTPSINGSILDGITRKSVIEILNDMGYKVTERRISIDEINDAYDMGRIKEIFGTGTAAVISPVGSLVWGNKEILINNGSCGEISKMLYNKLLNIQRGKDNHYSKWIIKVL